MNKKMLYRKRSLPSDDALFAEADRIYEYDSINGGLRWKSFANPAHPGRAKIGERVGGDDGHGYLMCMLLGHKFKVHQIVWLLHRQTLSKSLLDHQDRDRLNNRIGNLRQCSDQQNQLNTLKAASSTAGTKRTYDGKWYAIIEVNGKKRRIGKFETRSEANAAYREEHARLHGTFSSITCSPQSAPVTL